MTRRACGDVVDDCRMQTFRMQQGIRSYYPEAITSPVWWYWMLTSECVTMVSRRPLLRSGAGTGSSKVEASPDLLCTDVQHAGGMKVHRSEGHHRLPCRSLESRKTQPSRTQVWTLPAPYLFEMESLVIV